jgi:hypothetical protein
MSKSTAWTRQGKDTGIVWVGMETKHVLENVGSVWKLMKMFGKVFSMFAIHMKQNTHYNVFKESEMETFWKMVLCLSLCLCLCVSVHLNRQAPAVADELIALTDGPSDELLMVDEPPGYDEAGT